MNILIISAMEQELENIRDSLKLEYTMEVNHQKVYKISGLNNIYLMNVGIGKVNAAISVTQILNEIDFDCVINIGTCGAIDRELEVGDLIFADYVGYHDFDLTAFKRKKGYIPGLENYNEVFYGEETKDRFLQMPLNQSDEINEIMKGFNYKVGMILTGDVFVNSEELKKELKNEFGEVLAVDMESAAIVQSVRAYDPNICVYVIRSISDSADGEADVSFYDNLKRVTLKYVELIKVLLEYEFK